MHATSIAGNQPIHNFFVKYLFTVCQEQASSERQGSNASELARMATCSSATLIVNLLRFTYILFNEGKYVFEGRSEGRVFPPALCSDALKPPLG